MRNKNSAKTPQEKAELVEQIIEILKDVNNKIIQTEYVKMVSTTLNIDENALIKELSSYSNRLEYQPKFQENKKLVTKSSQFEEKAQKNLLSVFLTTDSQLSYQKLSEIIPKDIIHDETLIIVKNTIDKFANTINNVRELTQKLYTEFIEDDNLTRILTDIVELSEAFRGLNAEEFEHAVKENITRLQRCYQEKETAEIRQQYKEVNNDEIEALKVQMQLRDRLKLRTGENK